MKLSLVWKMNSLFPHGKPLICSYQENSMEKICKKIDYIVLNDGSLHQIVSWYQGITLRNCDKRFCLRSGQIRDSIDWSCIVGRTRS